MNKVYILMDLTATRVHLISILRGCTAYCVSIGASIERKSCSVSIRRHLACKFNLFFSLNVLFVWLNALFGSTSPISFVDAQPNSSILEALPLS